MTECTHESGSTLNELTDIFECVACGSMDIGPITPMQTREDGTVWWRLKNGGVWNTKAFINKHGFRLKPIAPGIYEDDNGDPHVNVSELLMLARMNDTPENRDQVLARLHPMTKNLVVLR